ncbi:MAG: hypothetical protein KDC44_13405, partial [Phaeodactylibacter sp.]|nr:hypothetical protein [Phaeodactylibacter sp.]
MLKYNLTLLCIMWFSLQLIGQTREAPPVILKGEKLPDLLDVPVDKLAGFRFEQNAWVQIPIQIDEMDWRLAYDLYNQEINNNFEIEMLVYTDPYKYTGPDENTRFDSNDELVFMAKDAGASFTGQNWPAGVIDLPMEVRIYDPLTDQNTFVYLFQQDGSLDPAAG